MRTSAPTDPTVNFPSLPLRARIAAVPSAIRTTVGFVFATLLALLVFDGARFVQLHGLRSVHGARIYYDAFHGAHHLWNRDIARDRHSYHTVSGYYRYHQTLRDAGFDVDVATDHGFDRGLLDDYDAFYVGEQTRHGHFMTDREVEDLRDWIEDGGGLFVTAEHTNAYHMNDVVNRLLEGLPIRVRNDGLTDRKQARPFSADWVIVSKPEQGAVHPVAEGVDAYMLYAGCSVDTPHGVLFSSKTSWSDRYGAHAPPLFPADGKRQRDELGGPLPGVAAMEFGKGRIVLVCDHNALSNPNIYWGDHHRFARQSMAWLAGPRVGARPIAGLLSLLLLSTWSFLRRRDVANRRISMAAVAVAAVFGISGVVWRSAERDPTHDVLFYRAPTAATRLMTKHKRGHYTFYSCVTRDPHLRPWVDDEIAPGHDALVLVAPTQALSEEELSMVDDYLARGRTVLYLANRRSLEAPAGSQLKKHLSFDVAFGESLPMAAGQSEMPYEVEGPPDLVAGIFRFWVSARINDARAAGLDPVVVLTAAGREPAPDGESGSGSEDAAGPRVDLLSERHVGPGTFAVLMPIGLFDTESLGELYELQAPIREQMREFSTRVVARAAGHDWDAELRPVR